MKKELINYFNNLSGRVVDDSDILSSNNETIKVSENLLNAIKKSDYSSSGSFKTCSFFGEDNKPVFACLKTKKPYSQPQVMFLKNKNNQIKRLNNKLISSGALVTPLYAKMVYRQSGKAIEIAKKIDGDVLAINNLSNFSLKILGKKITIEQLLSRNGLKAADYEKLGEALFEYNNNQQKLLLSLPQSDFDKLFKTFLIFHSNGIKFTDCHSENIMVGKNGFKVLDVDYEKAILNKNKGKACDINKLAFDYLNPFSYTNFYHNLFNESQQKQLYRFNIKILKKLIDGISNNNKIINVSQNYLDDLLFGMVGIENFLAKRNYIFDSQLKLRKLNGLSEDVFASNVKQLRKS